MAGRALAASTAFLILLSLVACRERREVRTPGAAPVADSLLLITIDTLRADRVGAYGHAAARTPTLDGVAKRGARFERAFATAPITLTSHASLLTGRYPPGHGARNNGMRMRPTPTLATLLRARGVATAAFVAAFPLDRRFGLSDGFDTYSDRVPRGSDGRQADERPAAAVAGEAIAWLQQHRHGRTFAWVHFFEPHAPYGRLEAAGRPPTARYDDEVATADYEAGRILAALGPRADSTLVVVAGDHGEAFGEHGEFTHGVFVYDTTLRVPLLIAGPGVPHGKVLTEPVSLVDVMPTVLSALGLPPADSDGIDLRPAFSGSNPGAGRVLYAESFAPLLDFGWSSLRTARSGRWKYVAAPRPELYDLDADAGESKSVVAAHVQTAAALDARTSAFSGAELPRGLLDRPTVDAETARRLQALGYIGARHGGMEGRRADPKDQKALARDMGLIASGELHGDGLADALAGVLAQNPDNVQAHVRLGYLLMERGRLPEANRHFRSAAAAAPMNADAWLGAASCAAARGDARAALEALERADAAEPGNPVVAANRAILLSKGGHHAQAIALLTEVVRSDPQFDEARFNLALAYARAGERALALFETDALLRRLPPTAPQRAEVERLRAELNKD